MRMGTVEGGLRIKRRMGKGRKMRMTTVGQIGEQMRGELEERGQTRMTTVGLLGQMSLRPVEKYSRKRRQRC